MHSANVHKTPLAAMLYILSSMGSLESAFKVQDVTDAYRCNQVQAAIATAFNNPAGFDAQLREHTRARRMLYKL